MQLFCNREMGRKQPSSSVVYLSWKPVHEPVLKLLLSNEDIEEIALETS